MLLLALVLVTSAVALPPPPDPESSGAELPDGIPIGEPLPKFGEPSTLDEADRNEPLEYGPPGKEESSKDFAGEDDEDDEDDEESKGNDDEDEPSKGDGGEMPAEIQNGLSDFGSIFDKPFLEVGHITRYFQRLREAAEKAFKAIGVGDEPTNGTTISESTDEEEDESGHKWLVHKSVIKSGDDNKSVVVETVDKVMKTDKREKRSNLDSEPIQ